MGGELAGPFLAVIVLKAHLDDNPNIIFSCVWDRFLWPPTVYGWYTAVTCK